jgi:dihydroorotate dehydrogenase electron transfer subunit
MEQALCTITSNVEVMPGAYLVRIEAPNMARSVQPGQFVTLRCGDFTLRRPFSVHQSRFRRDSGEGEIAILFKLTGKGTLWLSQRQTGETIDILGPLGKGFSIPPIRSGESQHFLLAAGGIGIAPLVFLMQHILGRCSGQDSSHRQITLIHGASTAAQLYPFDHAEGRPSLSTASPSSLTTSPSSLRAKPSKLHSLPKGIQFIPVTEDGSAGRKGLVTDILPDFLDWADHVYACGPVDMYKAMAETSLPVLNTAAGRSNSGLSKCQVSLEVRMGCGFGACYGCTINTRKGLKQVCRDGPVFELGDIIWQEVRI